jgi:diketogulonate reductase-like aldo/keto reductase
MDAAINAALESGYRLFDTAQVYDNDDVLSNAFKVLKSLILKTNRSE